MQEEGCGGRVGVAKTVQRSTEKCSEVDMAWLTTPALEDWVDELKHRSGSAVAGRVMIE